jgi:hypothetical protein
LSSQQTQSAGQLQLQEKKKQTISGGLLSGADHAILHLSIA